MVAFAFFMAWAALSASQTPPPQSPPQASDSSQEVSRLDDITVSARTRQAVRTFVEELSVSVRRDGSMAQFDRRVCPGVMGMQADYAQAINDEIARIAMAVRLDVGAPGCKPNILVIAGRDARHLERIVDAFPSQLYADERASRYGSLSVDSLRDERPVRWWHQVEYTPTRIASRLAAPERTDLTRAVVLLDMERVGAVNFEALAAYVAMVALARVDPNARVDGTHSILGLFQSAESRVSFGGATDWDMDYLRALYLSPRDAYRWQQENAIAARMRSGSAPPIDVDASDEER